MKIKSAQLKIGKLLITAALIICGSCSTTRQDQPSEEAAESRTPVIVDSYSFHADPRVEQYIKENRALLIIVRGIPDDYQNSVYSYSGSCLSVSGFRVLDNRNAESLMQAIIDQLDSRFDDAMFNKLIEIGAWETSNLLCLIDIDYFPLDKSMTYRNALNYYSASISLELTDISNREILLTVSANGLKNRERVREDSFINLILDDFFTRLKESLK